MTHWTAAAPQILNPNIRYTTTTTDEKVLNTEHRVTWYKYCPEQAVDLYSIAPIIANKDH